MAALDFKKVTLPLNNLIRPAWVAKLPMLVSLLLIVAIAYSLAALTWALLPQVEQARFVDSSRSQSVASVSKSPSSGIPNIPKGLFGDVTAEVTPPPVQQTELRETKLRLELKGVWASTDPKKAWAIISEPPRNEDSYGIDDALPGGATLKEIHPDHIVLSRGGVLEKLVLPTELMPSEGSAASDARRSSSTSSRRTSNSSNRSTSSQRTTNGATTNLANISRLSELKESLNKDPASLMGLIDAQPEIKNGEIVGFKVGGAQNEQLLRRLGLRRGDVITSVNGMNLNAQTNLPNLLNELKTADQVKLEYNRRGRPRSVTLNMND